MTDAGIERVKLALANPTPAPEPEPDPPPIGGDDGPGAPRAPRLPDGCPVTPLGVHGQTHWYLDVLGQLRGLKPTEHGRTGIVALFGHQSALLYRYWPRKDKLGNTVNFRAEHAAEDLMGACALKGVWDPLQRVRGVGAWIAADGGLIFHAGDALIIRGAERPTGAVDGLVYPAAPPGPRPLTDTTGSGRIAAGRDGPAARIEALYGAWRWETDAAPRLLLGWTCCAALAGALTYRPLGWLTGERGTGKSTLQGIVTSILGDVIASSDASAAGIWQRVGHASVPIAIDELEPDADPRHAQAVIRLARQAASGGLVLRGGADHSGTEFLARSCFLFSSILVPPLTPADRSRIVVLDLKPLEAVRPPTLVPHAARELGGGLRRRLADRWAEWPGRLETWQAAVVAVGHGGRGADAWGTLLAAADLALHDAPPSSDELSEWAEKVRPETVSADDAADWQECLAHLMTSQVDAYRGGLRHPLGHWITIAARGSDPPGLGDEPGEILATVGCRMVWGSEIGRAATDRWLAVANSHQGTGRVFDETRWRGGVWRQALRRVPGAEPYGTLRVGGRVTRVTLVPIAQLVD